MAAPSGQSEREQLLGLTTPPAASVIPATHRGPGAEPARHNSPTRVMSPSQLGNNGSESVQDVSSLALATRAPTTHCRVCTHPVATPCICSHCFVVGHEECLRIAMVEGYPFCGQCRPAAEAQAASMHHEEQRRRWRERIATQRRMMQSALISLQGAVATAANVAGGAGAMVVAGAAAAMRGAYDGATSTAAASFETSRRLPPVVDGVLAPVPPDTDEGDFRDACEGATQAASAIQGVTDSARDGPPAVPPIPMAPTTARPPGNTGRRPGSLGSLMHADQAAAGVCWTCASNGRSHRKHTYAGDCKLAPSANTGASSSGAPEAAVVQQFTPRFGSPEDDSAAAPTYVPPAQQQEPAAPDNHLTTDEVSNINTTMLQLRLAVETLQTSMTHMIDRMAVIESSNVKLLERVDDLGDRVGDVELQLESVKLDVQQASNRQYHVVEHATAEPNGSQQYDMWSGNTTPRPEPDDEEEYERAFDMPPPREPTDPFITSNVMPEALGEVASPSGHTAAPSDFTFAPFGGGFPGGGGMQPLQPAERAHHDLGVPQSAAELAAYHIPADMRADVVAQPLQFPPPGLHAAPAVANAVGGPAGGGVGLGPRPVRDELPVPQRALPAVLQGGASPRGALAGRGDLEVPLTDHEVGLLIKLFASLGTLPKLGDIAVTHRTERTRAWKVALQMKFDGTRPVVQGWFNFVWDAAYAVYLRWLKASLLERSQIRCEVTLPPKYQWLDNYMAKYFHDAMPKKIQEVCRAESLHGSRKTCPQMLYLVFQHEGPGNLADRDAVLRRLRSPSVCTDPAAALTELRSWYATLARCVELDIQPPEVQELFRACTSIYQRVFMEHADPQVTFRWQSLLRDTGGAHIQTHDALKKLNDHARAELDALILSGQRGSPTALPLTDSQREALAKDKTRKDARAAQVVPQANAVQATGGKAAGGKGSDRMSTTTSPWAKPCRDWANGCCTRGISCHFQHPGFRMFDQNTGELVNRCLTCGESGHKSRDCKRDGGGLDPKREEHRKAYQYRQKSHHESGGKGHGKDGGKNNGKDGGKKGGGRGRGGEQRQPTAKAVTASSEGIFPNGAAGIDSWANVYLRHKRVATGETLQGANESIKLADGSTVPCRTGIGAKGVPEALIPAPVGGEVIDLLPLCWLIARGCSYVWSDQPTVTTPEGNVLTLECYQGLPYATAEQLQKLFADLPAADAPGRDGQPAGQRVLANAVTMPWSCLRASRATTSTQLNRQELRDVLQRQQVVEDKAQRLLKKYAAIPDHFGTDGQQPRSAADFGNIHALTRYKEELGKPADLWEFYAGSGRLSAMARSRGLRVKQPLDHRWGHNLDIMPHQTAIMWNLVLVGTRFLFASPTCTPWSANSRTWTSKLRTQRRAAETLTLQFLVLVVFIQCLLGRSFAVENPLGSDIWTNSPLKAVMGKNFGTKYTLDQCRFDAELEGVPIRKSTTIFSNVDFAQLERRCDHNHVHMPLQGTTAGANRTAHAAVFPEALCQDLLDAWSASAGVSDGGRSTTISNHDDITGRHFVDLSACFADLRSLAQQRDLVEVWDEVSIPWFRAAFSADPPRLQAGAEQRLIHRTASAARAASGHGFGAPVAERRAEARDQEPDARGDAVLPKRTARTCCWARASVLRGVWDGSRFVQNSPDDSVVAQDDTSTKLETVLSRLQAAVAKVEQLSASSSRVCSGSLVAANDNVEGDRVDPENFDHSVGEQHVDPENFGPLGAEAPVTPRPGDFGPFGEDAPETPRSGGPVQQDVADDVAPEPRGRLSDLLRGDLAPGTWQYTQYDRDNATWLAAAQRRHAHRRRENVLTGVASVDLSGPHEPTPRTGYQIGQHPGRYFLVMTLRPDAGQGRCTLGTQTDDAPPEPAAEGAPAADPAPADGDPPEFEDSRGPLLYVEILERKSDATDAIMRIFARVRDDLGHLPQYMPHRIHSDKGQEFLSRRLEKYLAFHGVRRTTTAGYDPSGNGAGEAAVGYIKRKARQLLTGAQLPSNWWGVASACAASYARCAAGLETWPKLPFGTRVMLVQDPTARTAFTPRSVPATVFGPSERVSSGYVVYQAGRLKEVQNVAWAPLRPEELAYVKGRIHEWSPPEAPMPAPEADSWDAAAVPGQVQPDLADIPDVPQEAPLAEEVPEPERDLVIDRVADESSEEEGEEDAVQPPAAFAAAARMRRARKAPRGHPPRSPFAHAYVASTTATTAGSTDAAAPSSADTVSSSVGDDLVFEDQDEFAVTNAIPEPTNNYNTDQNDPTLYDHHDDDDPLAVPEAVPQRTARKTPGGYDWLSAACSARAFASRVCNFEPEADEGLDALPKDYVEDPAARLVSDAEVKNTIGVEAARWHAAAEQEFNESFIRMNAIAESTCADIEKAGGARGTLPMKVVWSIKAGGKCKCRAVVCGNFAAKDPSEEVWTAQAETASVMCGLRLALLRNWVIGKIDVKGAFMYAPLPSDCHVVVRPPGAWVRMGLVKQGVFWTLHRAVYGLRCSPKAWGDERDRNFRKLVWEVAGKRYHLVQCVNDSQVWRVIEGDTDCETTFVGLVIAYVDDLLLLFQDTVLRAGFNAALQRIWKLSSEQVLDGSKPFMFLGLEFAWSASGDLVIHQTSFIRQLLAEYGLDGASKSIQTVAVALPGADEVPPDPPLLKQLQKYAGEFNWLATRTRPDLAYYTSLLASTSKQYGAWSLQLAKKILRYLLGTATQGIVIKRLTDNLTGEIWQPNQLTTWSDAGFGGVGTRAQTGVMILWAGSPVLARSSRQTISALSTCEAEVCAAATAYICMEGMSCLLQEWHVRLAPPILLVDNKSALTLLRLGGSWRTRYFAIRAARILEVYGQQGLQLRYCPTALMGADGLTKLASGPVMDGLREIMSSNPPKLPTVEAELALSRPSPRAEAALATAQHYGAVPMVAQRRAAERYAYEVLEAGEKISDANLLQLLRLWGFARNLSRPNVVPQGQNFVYSEVFGVVYDRVGRWTISTVARLFPHVAKLFNAWLRDKLQHLESEQFDPPGEGWRWSAITVNRGYAAVRHVDRNNHGPSVIHSLGLDDDALHLWPRTSPSQLDQLDLKKSVLLEIGREDQVCAFDGTRPHQTRKPRGEVSGRFSVIFFQTSRAWVAPPPVLSDARSLGFNPASTEREAKQFSERFTTLADGDGYATWPVPQANLPE